MWYPCAWRHFVYFLFSLRKMKIKSNQMSTWPTPICVTTLTGSTGSDSELLSVRASAEVKTCSADPTGSKCREKYSFTAVCCLHVVQPISLLVKACHILQQKTYIKISSHLRSHSPHFPSEKMISQCFGISLMAFHCHFKTLWPLLCVSVIATD